MMMSGGVNYIQTERTGKIVTDCGEHQINVSEVGLLEIRMRREIIDSKKLKDIPKESNGLRASPP